MIASPSSRCGGAFSLVELLAVISLLAVLAVLVIPSIRGISAATELSVSGASMVDALNLGRQTALSSGRPVEVRFYEAPSATDSTLGFRAIGLYAIDGDGATQIGRLVFLRSNVVMSDTDSFGTLLSGLPSGQASVSGYPGTLNYRYFTFLPDGSAKLPHAALGGGDTWHVMLYDFRQPPTGQTAPKNHVTIQLVPETGRTRTYQPDAG